MKNRISACIFAGAILFSNIAAAEEEVIQSGVKVILNEPQYFSERVEISGNAAVTSETTLTVVVTVPEGDINNKEDIFYIGEVKTDETGSFSEKFYMENTDPTGRYTVHIKGKSIEETEGLYAFYTDAQKDEVISEINAFTTKEEVLTYFAESTKAYDVFLNMEILIKRYLALGEEYRDVIAEKVNKETLKTDTAAELINCAIVLEELNSLNDSSAPDNEIYGFFKENTDHLTDSELLPTISEWLGDEDSAEILSELMSENEYSEAEDLIEDYEEKAVVEAFNKAKWVDMEGLLDITAGYLGINDLDDTKEHKKKNNVYQAMVESYENSDEILKVYKNAVSDMKKVSTSGSSGSSSGGGSSSKGNSGIPVMTVEKNQNTEDTVDKSEEAEIDVADTVAFPDLTEKHWAYASVTELASKGIVSGDDKGYFNPDGCLTREAFVTMAVKAFGLYNENAGCSFSDVSENAWYYSYVASAVESGIISGVSDTEFGSGRNLTREDMAVILSRIEGVVSLDGEVKSFEDDENISDYAKTSVGRMAYEGIISGMGNNRFEPKAYTTRAQGAVLIGKCIYKG